MIALVGSLVRARSAGSGARTVGCAPFSSRYPFPSSPSLPPPTSLPFSRPPPCFPLATSCSFHSARPLQRLRRVVRADVTRSTRVVDDSEYVHYTERVVYRSEEEAAPTSSPQLAPPFSLSPSSPSLSSSSLAPVSPPASPPSPFLPPSLPPAPSDRRAALFAARDARASVMAISAAYHESGDSRRVRHWKSEQKRRRGRADRRRRKHAEQETLPRMEGYRAGDDDDLPGGEIR